MPTLVQQSRLPARHPWHDERVESNRAATAALASMAALPAGDPARERLRQSVIAAYLPMAHRLAARYHVGGEPLDDLFQVAALGLIQAVDRFDPARCEVFPAFAIPSIVGELRRHFRDRVGDLRPPRAVQELGLKVSLARDDLAQRLRREPTTGDLADHVGAAPEAVAEAIVYGRARRAASLDVPGVADRAIGPGDHDRALEDADTRLTLRPLLHALPQRERRIVWLRYWHQCSQSEIAADLGISQMHVSRLLSRALATMQRRAAA